MPGRPRPASDIVQGWTVEQPTERPPLPLVPDAEDRALLECASLLRPANRREVRALIRQLVKNPFSVNFQKAVDPRAPGCAEYYKVIKNPVCLDDIEKSLVWETNKGRESKDVNRIGFLSVRELMDALDLMIDNCFTYNIVSSLITRSAMELVRVIRDWYDRRRESLEYSCVLKYCFFCTDSRTPCMLQCRGPCGGLCAHPMCVDIRWRPLSEQVWYCPMCVLRHGMAKADPPEMLLGGAGSGSPTAPRLAAAGKLPEAAKKRPRSDSVLSSELSTEEELFSSSEGEIEGIEIRPAPPENAFSRMSATEFGELSSRTQWNALRDLLQPSLDGYPVAEPEIEPVSSDAAMLPPETRSSVFDRLSSEAGDSSDASVKPLEPASITRLLCHLGAATVMEASGLSTADVVAQVERLSESNEPRK